MFTWNTIVAYTFTLDTILELESKLDINVYTFTHCLVWPCSIIYRIWGEFIKVGISHMWPTSANCWLVILPEWYDVRAGADLNANQPNLWIMNSCSYSDVIVYTLVLYEYMILLLDLNPAPLRVWSWTCRRTPALATNVADGQGDKTNSVVLS